MLEIVEKKDMQIRNRKDKYQEYRLAMVKLLPWLIDNIMDSENFRIVVLVDDLAKEMGVKFTTKSDQALYRGIRYVLFNESFNVEMGKSRSGKQVFVIKLGTEDDKLPQSLSKEWSTYGDR